MKKTIAIVLLPILFLLFIGCGNTDAIEDTEHSEITITMPTDDTVNGYRLPESSSEPAAESSTVSDKAASGQSASQEAFDGQYYANTNTKKFHKSTCGYAAQIKDENLYITENRQELLDDGYEPCKRCNP